MGLHLSVNIEDFHPTTEHLHHIDLKLRPRYQEANKKTLDHTIQKLDFSVRKLRIFNHQYDDYQICLTSIMIFDEFCDFLGF